MRWLEPPVRAFMLPSSHLQLWLVQDATANERFGASVDAHCAIHRAHSRWKERITIPVIGGRARRACCPHAPSELLLIERRIGLEARKGGPQLRERALKPPVVLSIPVEGAVAPRRFAAERVSLLRQLGGRARRWDRRLRHRLASGQGLAAALGVWSDERRRLEAEHLPWGVRVGERLRHVLEELQRVAPARGDSGSGREPSIPRGGGILRTS